MQFGVKRVFISFNFAPTIYILLSFKCAFAFN